MTFEQVYLEIHHLASTIGEPRIVLACFMAIIIFLAFGIAIYFQKRNAKGRKCFATQKSTMGQSAHIITSQDIRAIAGEDMISTQLDLARAYIEIGKKQLAKKILDHAIKQGNLSQRQQAHQLMKNIS